MPTIGITKNKEGKYHPVIDYLTLSNGQLITDEIIEDITGEDEESVRLVGELFIEEIIQRLNDDRNYSLVFHACGYNGKAQQDLIEIIKDEYGVDVF